MMPRKSSLVVIAILFLLSSQCQGLEDNQDYPTGNSEGRSLLNFGFFRKIFQFFGWGDSTRKASREFPVYRRQEVLPYDVQNSPKRRSGFEPSPPDISTQDKKRKFPFKKSNRKKYQKKAIGGIFSRFFSPQKQFTTAIPAGAYQTHVRSYVSTRRNYNPLDNFVDESIQLDNFKNSRPDDTNTKRQFNVPNTQTSISPNLRPPKVESREPVISVYRSGDKITKNSYANNLNQNKTNISLNQGKLLSDKPFPKNIIKISKTNLATPSKTFNTKKENFLAKKNTYDQKKPVHPYPYVQPDKSLQKVKYNNLVINREPDYDSHYAAPLTSDDRFRRKKTKRERGLFKNMSDMASNFFGNIFSRSSSTTTSTPDPEPYPSNPLRRFQRNPPNKYVPPSPSPESKPLSSDLKIKSKSDSFDPSPQQGFVASDAFQPIFVPSYSMDSKLPSDVMKPLILPQRNRRWDEEEDLTTAEPELLDFFS